MTARPLTPKEVRVVKAKVDADLKGQPQQVAAQNAFPNQTPGSAAVSMTRELKKANVQEVLTQALIDNGITIDSAIRPVADGLTATKILRDGTDSGRPDHTSRLSAAKTALSLMGLGKQTGDVTINFIGHAENQRNVYDL